jgi:hypothetical protein
MTRLLTRLRSTVHSLGNDGAIANVRIHLAEAAEARAAVDRLAWRVAAADREAAARAAASVPVTPTAA